MITAAQIDRLGRRVEQLACQTPSVLRAPRLPRKFGEGKNRDRPPARRVLLASRNWTGHTVSRGRNTVDLGHEHACRRARWHGESNTVTGRGRGSAANGRSVPRAEVAAMRRVFFPDIYLTLFAALY
jgi:hypothetical protein